MALKPDRGYGAVTDIAHFWATHTPAVAKEKGGIASLVTAGSGVAMDSTLNVVDYVVDPSGAVPVGIMLADVAVYNDPNRFFKNFHNGEVLEGEKVCLVRKGWVVTDMIVGTPVAGNPAYLGASGNVTPTQADGAPLVGRFETSKDANGFAKLFVDI